MSSKAIVVRRPGSSAAELTPPVRRTSAGAVRLSGTVRLPAGGVLLLALEGAPDGEDWCEVGLWRISEEGEFLRQSEPTRFKHVRARAWAEDVPCRLARPDGVAIVDIALEDVPAPDRVAWTVHECVFRPAGGFAGDVASEPWKTEATHYCLQTVLLALGGNHAVEFSFQSSPDRVNWEISGSIRVEQIGVFSSPVERRSGPWVRVVARAGWGRPAIGRVAVAEATPKKKTREQGEDDHGR